MPFSSALSLDLFWVLRSGGGYDRILMTYDTRLHP